MEPKWDRTVRELNKCTTTRAYQHALFGLLYISTPLLSYRRHPARTTRAPRTSSGAIQTPTSCASQPIAAATHYLCIIRHRSMTEIEISTDIFYTLIHHRARSRLHRSVSISNSPTPINCCHASIRHRRMYRCPRVVSSLFIPYFF